MNLSIPTLDGPSFEAYCELPPRTPAPGIVLLTPIFGVDADMIGFAQRYAARGYVVVAPDLFWRVHPGPLGRSGDDLVKAVDRKKRVNVERIRGDVRSTIEFLRKMPECSGKVAAIGICFGGRYAVLAALDGAVEAAGAYHATEVGRDLDELHNLNAPLSLHYGGRDPLAPISEVESIQRALRKSPLAEICIYRGAKHGYSIPGNPDYDAAAAHASEARVFAMLERSANAR